MAGSMATDFTLSAHKGAFPTLITVHRASVSESWAIDAKASEILTQLSPQTLTADDAYTQADRIRRWAKATSRFDYPGT